MDTAAYISGRSEHVLEICSGHLKGIADGRNHQLERNRYHDKN